MKWYELIDLEMDHGIVKSTNFASLRLRDDMIDIEIDRDDRDDSGQI